MNTNEDWQREVHLVFSIPEEYCEIKQTVGCFMHIHVAPMQTTDLDQKYAMVQLQIILNVISYYDAAITQIMPAEGRTIYRPTPTSRRSRKPLFFILEKIKMKPMVYREMGQDKYQSWNFGHLTNQCGNIEFRRPPGVQTAADAKPWTAYTLSFINMAITMSIGWAKV
ncbi:hypothetical protein BKA67DRAFT_531451 [Truncatella angustata]|uniref:Uncharacterized protein n=1 Tax=Truncatella angustata TaxID=152316 RepID=A0A9P9A4Q4_9PEZI|nr:uncharacterized protein BKA67DRAFT_531451 [Truncatella angustata]KAH6661398.1 hypothetical protein BKA67DRAFT_531451 [Truncatella angustata]